MFYNTADSCLRRGSSSLSPILLNLKIYIFRDVFPGLYSLFSTLIPTEYIVPEGGQGTLSPEGIRLFCRKSIVGRILISTNGINNEEALE